MFHTSGLLDVCVTSTVVTGQTSSPRTSTAGSGLPTKLGWLLLTAIAPSMTGLELEVSTHQKLSQITENKFNKEEKQNLVWLFSITSMEMESNGTTLLVAMRSQSSARMSRVILPLPDKLSQISESLEQQRLKTSE